MTVVTSQPPLATLPLPLSSSSHVGLEGFPALELGGLLVQGASEDGFGVSTLVLTCLTLSPSPFLGITLVLTMLEFRRKES